ncbi:MAG: hypothetical protein L0Y44_01375 [Phycisphaerales bacterium]|nr:hypothetical protein [Phycisphaerales bacterium]MCI0674929.1 hypothetical protein [Phycisphaerales bacterium]
MLPNDVQTQQYFVNTPEKRDWISHLAFFRSEGRFFRNIRAFSRQNLRNWLRGGGLPAELAIAIGPDGCRGG